jgi:hypothetical protein
MVPRDLDRAIQFVRRAVELAPESVTYREALALYLLAAEQRKEAMAVMREVGGGKHPIYLLAGDLDLFPMPDGAVFLPADTENFATMQLERGRISNYANLRVRMYAVPLRSADIEAFYRGRWPSFQLFEQDEAQQRPDMSIWGQFLRLRNGVLEPSVTRTDFQSGDSGTPPDGMWMAVIELRNVPPDKRTSPAHQKLPSSFGDLFSFMIIVNTRNIRSR